MRSHSAARLALCLSGISGCSALIHQVVWIRRMVDTLGATADTFAAVTGTFFLGLALGGWLSLRPGPNDRTRLWRRVGLAECMVGAFALLVLASPLLSERLAMLRWHSEWSRLLLPLLLIAPPAAAMGVVTPWLIRLCSEAGRRISVPIYAVNTAGGIAGILLSLVVLLPRLGTIGTGMTAVALNGLAAAIALFWASATRERPAPEPIAMAKPDQWSRPVLALAFGSGLLVMSAEVIVQMQFAQVMVNSHFSGGFVLLLVLSGLALGAALSNGWWRAFRRNFAVAMQSGLFWAAFGGLRYQPYQVGSFRYFLQAIGPGFVSVVAPFALAGLIFPLLLKHVEESARVPLGWIFAVNGLGGWFGAELAQGTLLPRLGLWGAACLAAAGYAALIAILPLRQVWRLGVSGGAFLFCLVAWGAFSGLPQVQPSRAQRIRAVGIGREGVVAVAEGKPDDWRIIFNNSYTLGGSRAATNQERQALLPILLHGEAKCVATLGVATGSTASGALLHPGVERLDAIELSPLVMKFAERYFGPFNRNLFTDSRVRALHADARWEVLRRPGAYDVIIGDLFLPWRTGEGRLFTREHFRAVQRALRSGGLFCQWLPMYQLTKKQFEVIAQTFREVFPDAFIVRGDFYADNAIVGLIGGRALEDIRWDAVARACSTIAAGESRDPLVRHVEGVSMLVVGPLPSRSDVRINTLDDGWLEWDAARNIIEGGQPWFTGVPLARFLRTCHRGRHRPPSAAPAGRA